MANCEMNGQTQEEINGDFTDDKIETETKSPSPTSDSSDSPTPITNEEEDDEDDRKVFIGGLHWNTKQDGLRTYCEKFGDVLKCDLKFNNHTQVSRCFAFVVFKNVSSVKQFLKVEKHELDGKTIDPKPADKQEDDTKIFIGGLSTEATEDEVRSHFEKYGKITELTIPVDESQNRRPFAFIVFAKKSSVTKAIAERMQTIHGKECEVKKSVPKGAGRGWRGGNRGGRAFQGGYPQYVYQSYYNSPYDYYNGMYGYQGYGWGYDQTYAQDNYNSNNYSKTRGRSQYRYY